jgi:hypothetical protein
VCLCPYKLLNGLTNLYQTWYVIKELEPISTAYFINPFHESLCLYMCPPIVAMQRLSKHVTAATTTRNKVIVVGGSFFYEVHVVSKESRRLVLPLTSSLFNRLSRVLKVEVECGRLFWKRLPDT